MAKLMVFSEWFIVSLTNGQDEVVKLLYVVYIGFFMHIIINIKLEKVESHLIMLCTLQGDFNWINSSCLIWIINNKRQSQATVLVNILVRHFVGPHCIVFAAFRLLLCLWCTKTVEIYMSKQKKYFINVNVLNGFCHCSVDIFVINIMEYHLSLELFSI